MLENFIIPIFVFVLMFFILKLCDKYFIKYKNYIKIKRGLAILIIIIFILLMIFERNYQPKQGYIIPIVFLIYSLWKSYKNEKDLINS